MLIATMPTPSSGKSVPNANEFSPQILQALRQDLGKEAILSSRDERLTRLHGYYSQGWESVGILPDKLATLGPSWQELDENTYRLDKGGNTSQVLSFDLEQGETRLSTIHSASMIETLHESLILDREGRLRKESQTAC